MRPFLIFCLVFMLSLAAFSQKKVKYKDLFPLLKEKNYVMAEPDLRVYLSNEKNQDEGNPNYHMGLILEEKFMRQDVLGDTSTLVAYGDSAKYYFREAIKYIDDKELRKNDEYYQEFYRRDLRTGEFGVKLSDVHLDIENHIKAIDSRIANIDDLYSKLSQLKAKEEEAVSLFNDLVEEYSDYNAFVMQADLPEIGQLGDISGVHDSMQVIADDIMTLANTLEIQDKYQSMKWTDIDGFIKLDAFMRPYDGSIEAYHFDNWVDATKEVINGDIADMKFQLTQLDEELEKANQQLNKSRSAKFPLVLPDKLREVTSKYAASTAPLDLLEIRVLENIYLSLTNQNINPKYQDSSLVAYQYMVNDSLLGISVDLYELTMDLRGKIKPSEKSYFNFYNARYGDIDEVVVYVNKMNDWSDFIRVQIAEQLEYWDFRNNWGIMPDDTIPLIANPSKPYNGNYIVLNSYKYTDSNELLSIGYEKENKKGFIARFGEDRVMKWKTDIEEKSFFDNVSDTVRFSYDTLLSAEEDFAAYWYIENPTDTTSSNLLVSSVNLEGEANWITPLVVDRQPTYSTYSEAIRQHTIFLYPRDAYPLPGDELGYIVIDRTGEAR